MTCLDIGVELIDVAKARLSNHQDLTFLTSSFEDWIPGETVDLIISATAFHWVAVQPARWGAGRFFCQNWRPSW